MLSSPLRWVSAIALIVLSLTQNSHTTTVSLLDLMPKCASKCLESFISIEYPRNACSTGCDLNYLCTRNTTSGYTLGEAALRCSLSLCSIEVALSFDTYSICDSVPGALPRTHPTIVATVTSPANPTSTLTRPTTVMTTQIEPTETRPTSSTTSAETDHTSTAVTTIQSPISTTDSTDDPLPTEAEEPTSTTTSDPPPNPTSSETASASSQGGLNSGAVIGVSVVSGLAGFFIIGVVIFFCCRKARRRNAQDQEFFEIGGHMSEPVDFNFPPKRPPMGPRPSPGAFVADSESARLVPPMNPEYQSPAVIVTRPDNGYDYSHTTADRAALRSYSNLEFDAASVASSRTVSDLLPEKPTYELYPRPLRWSQHKKSRPSSGATFFEEEHHSGSRDLPSPSMHQSAFLEGSTKGRNRPPLAGLPANPRAMMYGFGRGQAFIPAMKDLGRGKRPAFASAQENLQPSRQAALHQTSPYQSPHTGYIEDLDNYQQSSDAGFVGAKVIQPHNTTRGPYHTTGMTQSSSNENDYSGYDFEFDLNFSDNTGLESRRASRHSGRIRPLTPVREIRTPIGEARNPIGEGPSNYGASRYPPGSSLGPHDQPPETVSRPRIVRQDDIKRVEIRRGKPSPKEVSVPYCPDDYWQEQSSEPSGYNAPRIPSEQRYAPAGMFGRMPKKKPSPLERNLTPSRRGADLILQVE
ncbi:hypothetical protein BJX70DRAFT_387518 [Aspergillus crustosus]